MQTNLFKNKIIYPKTMEQKSIFISFLLHSAVIFFYFFYFYNETKTKVSTSTITLSIEDIQTYQPQPKIEISTNKPVDKETPNKIEEIVHNPIVPAEPKKAEPIKEELTKSEPIIEKQPMIKPQEIKKIEPTPIIQEETKKETVAVQSETINTSKSIQKISEQPIKQEINQLLPKEVIISKTDFAIIRDKVLANLIYPNIARRMGWNGLVQVAITIDEKGRFLFAKIENSSGRTILDEAALNAANELKNELLPKPSAKTTLILPISFQLK